MNNYNDFIENERIKEENRIALEKNNKELDRLCNRMCLIIGWLLVFSLLLYIILLEITKKI